MAIVKNLIVRVGADFSELSKEMNKAGKYMKSAGKELQSVGKNMTLGITLPIVGIGVAAVKSASDLKEVQNVVDTAFGKSAKAVDAWSKTAIKSYGLSELQAKQFAGTMRAMTGSMGVSSDEADKMSMNLSSLAGDMASFYNLDPSEAFDKLRSGISGETEPLKALGVNMSVTNMEAYALSRGINKSWKEMSSAEQATLRYNYIMDTTKMAQGDFAKTNTGFANSMRVVKEQLVSVGAQLGGILLPYLESALGKIRGLLDRLQSLSPEMQKKIVEFALVAAAIGPAIWAIGKLTTTVSAVLFWSANVGKALTAVSLGTKGVGAVLTAVFGPAGVVILVIAGIALVVAGLIWLWNNNETFKTNIINIWNAIVTFITPIVENIKTMLVTSWQFIQANILPILVTIKDTMVSTFTYTWTTLKPVVESIKTMLAALFDFIVAIAKFDLDVLKTIWEVVFQALEIIIMLFVNRIKILWDTWGSNIIAFFKITWDMIVGVLKGSVEIFTGIFQMFTGLLTGNWSKVWQGMKNIFIGIWDSMKAIFKGGINFFINGINTMINGVNAIKIPNWVPAIGGMGFHISNIPMLANGGIVTKPTLAMVGEGRENEAVIPLSKLDKMINGNKGPLFIIENFQNNTDKDMETLAYQLEFYRNRAAKSIGG